MGKVTSVHDTFIRAIMADRNIAIGYFQSYLPSFIADELDFSSLTQLPDVYVSAELQKTMSDIVYSCQRKDGKGEIKVSLLIEHKSYPDKFSPVQIGSYIFSGLQKQIEAKEKRLSMIIPILLYHGKQKWEYLTLQDLFTDLQPEYKQFLPNFQYVYNNLGELSDHQLEAVNNRFLAAAMLSLKHSFDKQWLENNVLRILTLAEQVPENLLRQLIVYIFGRSGLQEEQIIVTIETLPIALRKSVMSTLDIFVEKGKSIGLEQGKSIGLEQGKSIGLEQGKSIGLEQGKKIGVEIGYDKALQKNTVNMLAEGFPLATICRVLEVSSEYVLSVQKELQK